MASLLGSALHNNITVRTSDVHPFRKSKFANVLLFYFFVFFFRRRSIVVVVLVVVRRCRLSCDLSTTTSIKLLLSTTGTTTIYNGHQPSPRPRPQRVYVDCQNNHPICLSQSRGCFVFCFRGLRYPHNYECEIIVTITTQSIRKKRRV